MEKVQFLDQAIANIAKKVRETSGLSYQKFADFARMSKTHMSQIEKAERGASLNSIYLIADAVRMSPVELVNQIEGERQRLMRQAASANVSLQSGYPSQPKK